jgi:drug/metabolite transporter (DMT)-like permease
MKNNKFHIFLLFLCSFLWGTTFVAQSIGAEHVGAFTYLAGRSWVAVAFLTPVVHVMDRFFDRRGIDNRRPRNASQRKYLITAGCISGVLLCAASAAQQIGIAYTTASKAGFITALYVVLVPVAAWLLFRKNPGRIIWLGVAMAVVALYFLCIPAEGFTLQGGDLLEFGCAICYTVQILCVDHYAPKVSGVRLARDEFLITGVLSLLIALFTETMTWEGIREALIPLLYSGIMSSAVGFTLQIIGQRDTDPTVASLLMCLESVFAVLTGAIILGEKMTVRETVGCVMMFSAVILAQLSPVISSIRRNGRSHR